MWTRLLHLWDTLRSSYWFVPSLMFLAAVGLWFGMLEVDRRWIDGRGEVSWVYLGSAQGARGVLAAIGGSIITVAGVVFSITIVTLAQASTQFGPRILRNFMRDLGNQVVLGTFVATFVYSILVLRTVRGRDEGDFVPHASVALAVVLAVASIAVLIYFIHHVSVSLQAPVVIAGLGRDLTQAMEGRLGVRAEAGVVATSPPSARSAAAAVTASGGGYVQAVDVPTLVGVARECDLVLHVRADPGAYVVDAGTLLEARPEERCSDAVVPRLRSAFILGSERTPEQDVQHTLSQGVEIALRALSPGVNDPFTAMNCVDWLGSALVRLGREAERSPCYCDETGAVRVVVPMLDFAALADTAFDPIRRCADQRVLCRLLEVLAALAEQLDGPAARHAIVAHADRVLRRARRETVEPHDLAAVEERYGAVVARATAAERPA